MRSVSADVFDRFRHHPQQGIALLNANMRTKAHGMQFCLDFFRTPDKFTANGISLMDFIGGLKLAELIALINEATAKKPTAQELGLEEWDTKPIESKKILMRDLFAADGVIKNVCDAGKYDDARMFVAKKWLSAAFPQADLSGIDDIQKYHSQVTMGIGTLIADLFFTDLKVVLQNVGAAFISSKERIVNIFYQNKQWHYVVTDAILLQMPTNEKIPISRTHCDFIVTNTGFEFEKIEYDNPDILNLLENPTKENQCKFLANLWQKQLFSPEAKEILFGALLDFSDQHALHAPLIPGTLKEMCQSILGDINLRALYHAFLYELDKDTIKLFRKAAVKKYLNVENKKDIVFMFPELFEEMRSDSPDSDVASAFNRACFQLYCPAARNAEQMRALVGMLGVKEDVVRYPIGDRLTLITLQGALLDAVEVELKKQAPSSPSSPSKKLSFFSKSPAKLLVERVMPSIHLGIIPDEDKLIVDHAFYQIRKCQVSKILPYLTPNDAIRLIFELASTRDLLHVEDPDFPVPSANTLDEFKSENKSLYESVAGQLRGQKMILELDKSALSDLDKMTCLYRELLTQSNSPVKAALEKVLSSSGELDGTPKSS